MVFLCYLLNVKGGGEGDKGVGERIVVLEVGRVGRGRRDNRRKIRTLVSLFLKIITLVIFKFEN